MTLRTRDSNRVPPTTPGRRPSCLIGVSAEEQSPRLTAAPSGRSVLHSVVEQGDVAAVQRTLAADGHTNLVNTPDTRAQHFW